MKKVLILILTVILAFSALTVVIGASTVGYGAVQIAKEVNLIKTGLLGKELAFSDTDFKAALGINDFDKLTISALPDSSMGTLMLGDRKITEPTTIRRRNVCSLSFIPTSASVSEASFRFFVDDFAAGEEIVCTMKFIDRINYQPEINTATENTLTVTTQKGISVYGKMIATDPEGDEIEYIIVSYPENGYLSICADGCGEFTYTPNKSYTGKDSFTYVARDEYGNYSYSEKVSIRVNERMSEVVYADMEGSRSYNAAIAMTAMGIMSGKRLGDNMYFMPRESVSRAEFVAMAMKSVGIRADSTLSATFFDDNDDIPAALVGYVATAQRIGIIHGSFDGKGLYFRPNDQITRYEAAIIMSALTNTEDEEVSTDFSGSYDIPVWARGQVSAMLKLGIFESEDAASAKEPLCREEAAEYLYRLLMAS